MQCENKDLANTSTRARWVNNNLLAWHSQQYRRNHMKNITIVPATGGAYSDLAIAPGTTPRDVKKQLNLADEFVLTRGRGSDRRQVQTERLAVLAEFTRARNLLNQIARNSQRQTPLAVIEIVSHLIAVERQLSNLKKS